MKDLRTELYQLVYEQPIYPKNLYLERAPYTHAEYKVEVTDRQIRTMHERGIWVPPARSCAEQRVERGADRSRAIGRHPFPLARVPAGRRHTQDDH